MTDDRGLGWLESPRDARDWAVDALYAVAGVDAPGALPGVYHVPAPLYPVLDQGSSPMCVAYSAAGEQGWYDLRDQGGASFDEALFFRQIGGTASGAYIRAALARRLASGYPLDGHPELAGRHRIAAYYAVPVSDPALCAAVLSFGPLVLGTPWARSWFRPHSDGLLPAFDEAVGGHAVLAVGWDDAGLRLRNSWGTDWGQAGEATLPWDQLWHVREAWKAIDVIDPRPLGSWHVRIAHGATVRVATMATAGCISWWDDREWTGATSTAPCRQPVIRRGCRSGQATVAYVTAGAFRGRFIHIGTGVTPYRPLLAASEEDPA